MVTSYMDVPAEQLQAAQEVLVPLFGLLRAQHLMMWNHHWEASGEGAYGAHLLFARIYGDAGLVQDVDTFAEKLMGYFGPEAVNASVTVAYALRWLQHWEKKAPLCIVARSLQAEKDLQTKLKVVYDTLKSLNTLPLGLDDFIMALASRHETNIYLLQQLLDDPKELDKRFASGVRGGQSHLPRYEALGFLIA